MKISQEPMPAHWASYLINGDASGLTDAEIERVDAYIDDLGVNAKYIDVTLSSDRDAEAEPYFSWSFDLYGGDARGGDLLDYTVILN